MRCSKTPKGNTRAIREALTASEVLQMFFDRRFLRSFFIPEPTEQLGVWTMHLKDSFSWLIYDWIRWVLTPVIVLDSLGGLTIQRIDKEKDKF